MATFGTPYEGRDNIIGPAIYVNTLKLGLKTNALDSLGPTSVLADITEPVGTGYARITLNGTWSFANGVFTYDHGTPDDPIFTNSGVSNWTGDVTGAFITDDTYILHFKDNALGAVTMTPSKQFQVDISSLAS